MTKNERRKIYRRLGAAFEEAETKGTRDEKVNFLYATISNQYICIALGYALKEQGEVMDLFPEFALFHPSFGEIIEEGLDFINGGAWFSSYEEGVFYRKAMLLYFCAEMCK